MNKSAPKDRRFRDAGQQAAHAASLNAYACSEQGQQAAAELAQVIIAERQKSDPKARSKRGNSLSEFERSVAAFLYELLKGHSRKPAMGWVGVALAAGSGTGEHVGDRDRRTITKGLERLELLEVDPGNQFVTRNAFGSTKPDVRPGRTTRIRALPSLIDWLDEKGLTADNFNEHFVEGLPKRTIYLKAQKVKNGSRNQVGKTLPVKYTPHVQALEKEVQAINEFLIGFDLKGGLFRGYKRRFNEGNVEGFHWNKGGRLYADFQRVPSTERKKFTIDGEPTAELDVSASYLTVLHGIHGVPFDTTRDAYASEVFKDRDVIKAFINQSLGSPKLMTHWSKAWNQKFVEKYGYELTGRYKPKNVRKEVIALHPLLAEWGNLGTTWADLMFIESEAMIYAINTLINDHQAPSYVVHDALIVRRRDLAIAKAAIEAGYKAKCGLTPKVKEKPLDEVDAKDLNEETDLD